MKYFLLFLLYLTNIFCFSQKQYLLYFESNKANLSKTELTTFKKWIVANKNSKILVINGYTDEDGSNNFNDTLAKKRVDFVFELLKNKILIRSDFKTRSFGENFVQSKNKALNRKVVVFYIDKKDFAREDEILGIKSVQEIKLNKPERVFADAMQIENNDGSVSEILLDRAFMKTIDEAKVGQKLKLENLNFVINTFIVTNNSRPKMFELLSVLRQNPKLKIEIQGNLCCQPVDRLNLSTERAKTIYNFLVFYKISKSRLSYKGFGSSNPIFALPEKSEDERAANRRVEILILENE